MTALLIVMAVCLGVGERGHAALTQSAPSPKGHERLTIKHDGRDREFLLYVPTKYDKSKAVPLVLMLHGMGGTALNSQRETGWSGKAEKETFIVAYPEGTPQDATRPANFRNNRQAWNDGSGRFHVAERKIDDVAFLIAVMDRLAAIYKIDSRRIYVTGFSNGASMAFRVGAERSDRVTAIAPNAGACWTDTLKLKRGLSVCYITGTADTLNPLEGGFPKLALGGRDQGEQKKPPVLVTIEKWAKALECGHKPNQDQTAKGVRMRNYGPGRDGAVVQFTTVEGLGHHWAGGKSQAPELLVGKNTQMLNATDAVWEFFVAHPRQ